MDLKADCDVWRTRIEQLIASGMKVGDWASLNGLDRTTVHKWLAVFRDECPSMFGEGLLAQVDPSSRYWYESFRRRMVDSRAMVLSDPAGRPAPSFAVVDAASVAGPSGAAATAGPSGQITVTIGDATVACPVGCDAATLATVLSAVRSL